MPRAGLPPPVEDFTRLEEAKSLVRGKMPFYDKDRYFSPDIEKARSLIKSSAYNAFMPPGCCHRYSRPARRGFREGEAHCRAKRHLETRLGPPFLIAILAGAGAHSPYFGGHVFTFFFYGCYILRPVCFPRASARDSISRFPFYARGKCGRAERRGGHDVDSPISTRNHAKGLKMSRPKFLLVALLAAVLLAGPLPTLRAAITPAGDVEPTNPATWTSSTAGYVGNTSEMNF